MKKEKGPSAPSILLGTSSLRASKWKKVNVFKQFVFALYIAFLPFTVFLLPSHVLAQSQPTYPIPALGYCRDAKECSLYCKIPENKAACWSYGKYVLNANVLGTTTMSTQERTAMETKARQYGVTFPIFELDNCTGPQECRDYCELTANQTACMNFAKKKGFAKETGQTDDGIPEEKRQAVMQRARTELGCSSAESCRNFCEQNRDTCETFAKKHGIAKEPPKETLAEQQRKTQMLQVAQQDLGCSSMETCKTLCLQNPQQCMTFAQKHGFDKKEEIPSQGLSSGGQSANSVGASVRPPCANDGSCQQYCAQHPDECPGYQTKPGLTPAGGELRPPTGSTFSSPSGGFVGPTGCRTEEECKAYCQTNPGKCPGFIKAEEKLRAYPSYAPIKTPGEYKGPTPYLNPGSNSGYPKPTGTQYNYPPPTYPTYIQSPPNSGYSQPTPMSGGYQPSTGTVQYQPMTNPLQ